MARSPLHALADVMALAEEGLDALVLLSLDAVSTRRRPAGIARESSRGLALLDGTPNEP